MKEETHQNDETVSALFTLHDRIHAVTRQYVEGVLRARGELDERVRMLSSVLDSIGDGLTVIDKAGKLIFVSETARKTAGMAPEDDWSEQLEENYSVYDADGKTLFNRDELLQDLLVQRRVAIEKECLVKSDRLPPGGLWVRIKATPVFDEAGELTGAVNIFHDITSLKSASDRIHDLYNNAPCGYQSLNAEGIIIEMNLTALDWIGFSREETVGKKKFESLLTDDCQPTFRDAFSRLKATGQVSGIRLQILRRTKPPLTVLWSSRVVYAPDGALKSTRGTLFDISERTNLEAQRNTLASLITHDIKNHLVAESVFMDVVLESKLPELKQEDKDLIEAMRSANHQFLNVTNDLLQLHRLETNGLSLDAVDTDLVGLVSDVVRLSEPAARLKDVEIVARFGGLVPPARANALSLHHAIYNLVDNAVKFSPAGGKVMLSVDREGEEIVFRVADGGPGLTAEQQTRLFTAPWSLRWEGSERISTGLGLYLSHQIVESHGGTLTVESSTGKGSTFVVRLPANQRNPS